MIDARNVDPAQLSMSLKMTIQEAHSRGWEVMLYYIGSGQMRITRSDGKTLEVYNATPPTTSFTAGHSANNKFLTMLLCQDNNLPIPRTFMSKDVAEIKTLSKNLFNEGKKVVIKPLDAAHGHGVSVNLDESSDLDAAIKYAQQFAKATIVQEFLEKQVDVRLTCINHECVAGLIRMPARVMGDGQHDITQLIEIENQNPSRGENYEKPLNKIKLDIAQKYLGNSINQVPPEGEYISVLGTANVGTGGETQDVTDDLPQWLKDLAVKASKAAALPVCGVDFLLKMSPKSDHAYDQLDPKLLELNKCPSLFIHETPSFGLARPTVKAYVDYLETI